ncbi:MAG: hypothetical protein EBR09_06880 [Proteobacteria bacterium]|nr:hypothetical protein [Pseudomonadota bacterium]
MSACPERVVGRTAAGFLQSTAFASGHTAKSGKVPDGRGNSKATPTAGEPSLKVIPWSSVSLNGSKPLTQSLFDFKKLAAVAQPLRAETLQAGQDIAAYLRNRESSVSVDHRLQMLANRTALQLLPESPVRAYFGLLHAHTFSSDGLGDARDAFRMARDVAGLDFFAVTDHSEYWWKKASPDWLRQQTLAIEESRSNFIALAGFEYSHPLQGHVVVLNSKSWTSALQSGTLGRFYDWLSAPEQTSALAVFAHPGFHNYRNWFDLGHLQFDPRLEDRIIGLETIHKNVWQRSFKGYKKQVSFLDEALAGGWRVGPVASQDNHTPYWGLSDQSRIAVLMNGLTRNELIDALRRRHFYSTQSPQLQLAVGLYEQSKLRAVMGDVLDMEGLSNGSTFLRLRMLEPNPFLGIRKIEFLVNGSVARTLSFLDSPTPMSNLPSTHESLRPPWWDRWLHNGIVTVRPFELLLQPEYPVEPEIFEVDLPLTLPSCGQSGRKTQSRRMSLAVRIFQGDRGQYLSMTSPMLLICR